MNESNITNTIPKPDQPMDELTELKYQLEVKKGNLEAMLDFNYFYKKHHTIMGFQGIPYNQARFLDKQISMDWKIIDDAPFPWYVRRQMKKDIQQLTEQIAALENPPTVSDLSPKQKPSPNREER